MSDHHHRLLLDRHGPGGSAVEVDTDALRAVAGNLRRRLTDFAARRRAFAEGTAHRDGELGRLPLPETHRVNDRYARSQRDAVASLEDLASWLERMADRLDANAGVYDAADEAGAAPARGRRR
jgi:hypothetical protein